MQYARGFVYLQSNYSSASLGRVFKPIIVWDMLVFFQGPSLILYLFPDLFLLRASSMWPTHSLRVLNGTCAGGAGLGTLSNPSAVSRDESVMNAGFPSSSWDAGPTCKVDLFKNSHLLWLVSYSESCIVLLCELSISEWSRQVRDSLYEMHEYH